jgi:L,D-transpeptidase YcbB
MSRKPGERGQVLKPPTVRHGMAWRLTEWGLALALAAGPTFSMSQAAADPPVSVAAAAPGAGSTDAAVGPATLTPFDGNVEIEDRLAPSSRLTLAGERLNDDLLRRFYLAHRYGTVWDHHPAQAASLWEAVRHAGDQGLDPAMFHTAILSEHWAALSPVERDLLLSDAFLSYADALAQGAVPLRDRSGDEALQPEPIDIVAALDAAIAAPDPATAIEALAPSAPEYYAMRRAYMGYRAVAVGDRGPGPGQGRVFRGRAADAQRRARQLAVNLERLRWLPRTLPADRIVVDTAVARLQLFHDDRPVFTTRVVVGELDNQTPEFQSVIRDILFNPPWNVPRSIFEKEIRPKLASDHHYLAEHHMRYRGPMAVQQEAGPYSALGRLKFEMADRFDVYLHDTPEKWRFQASERMMSHGCVRVETPQVLAGLLLGQSPESIAKAIAVNHTHGRALPKPMPVFIVYRTAAVESDGSIEFRADPYQRDNRIWAYLDRAQRPPIAQDSMVGQRKG